MTLCSYCHQDKGERACPALGGLISPVCCGQNRGIRLECPVDCRYYRKNEEYQRARLGGTFHQAWIAQTEPLYRQREAETLELLVWLELEIYRHFQTSSRGTDEELSDALDFLNRQLSPIHVIEAAGTRLGKALWQQIDEAVQAGRRLDPDRGQTAVQQLAQVFEALRDPSEPRRALHALLGHVEQYIGVPDEPPDESPQGPAGGSGIILPGRGDAT